MGKRRKLKAEDDWKSPAPATTTKKDRTEKFIVEDLEITSAPTLTTNTARTRT